MSTLKSEVVDLRKQMQNLVLRAAKEIPDFGFSTHYADGSWGIRVSPEGTITNEGYALETYGETGHLEQLSLWELAELLQVAEAHCIKAG